MTIVLLVVVLAAPAARAADFSCSDPATGQPLVCDDGDPCTVDEPCDPIAGCVVRRLPGLEFVRCRASGVLPIESCRTELPRRVRRPLVRMQRVLDRNPRATSHRQLTRTLARLDRACQRAKRRLERALGRRGASDCLRRQRRGLDDLCPDRSVVDPGTASRDRWVVDPGAARAEPGVGRGSASPDAAVDPG